MIKQTGMNMFLLVIGAFNAGVATGYASGEWNVGLATAGSFSALFAFMED